MLDVVSGQETILVVDDNPDNLAVAASYLKQQGYKIASANNGRAALQRAALILPHLILLDVNMPDMSGFEVCRLLKENKDLQHIPVIFLTALTDSDAKNEAFSMGGVDYLSKPFQKHELLARVKIHLSIEKYQHGLETLVQQKTQALRHEISEHKSAKREVENYRDQLEIKVDERTKQLTDAIYKLKITQNELVESKKNTALSGLVAGIAHEINTPLGVSITAISHLSILIADLESECFEGHLKRESLIEYIANFKEVSDLLQRNLDRSAKLVMGFKKISVDENVEVKQPFELLVCLQELVDSLIKKSLLGAHNITFEAKEIIKMNSFPGVIKEVVESLIMNSIVHGFKEVVKGEIRIVLTQSEGRIGIDYQDNGLGLNTLQREKVFEPFYTTSRGSDNTGLGMSVSYNSVVHILMGHFTCIESSGGAHFKISFPVVS